MSGATTTFTSARFLTPDYLVRGQDNALSCPLWADGALVAPSGGTVSVYDASNNVVVNAAAVTVAGSIATYAVPAGVLPTTLALGMGWRVEWTLTVGSVATMYRNAAGLVRSRLVPVVTDRDLFRRVSGLNPALGAAALSAELTDYQDYIDEAWVTLHGKLTAKGSLPHLIMEPSALREPHLLLTLALIFEDFRTRLDETHGERAASYWQQYELSWRDLRFEYDSTDSGQSDGRTKRSPQPTIWLCSR